VQKLTVRLGLDIPCCLHPRLVRNRLTIDPFHEVLMGFAKRGNGVAREAMPAIGDVAANELLSLVVWQGAPVTFLKVLLGKVVSKLNGENGFAIVCVTDELFDIWSAPRGYMNSLAKSDELKLIHVFKLGNNLKSRWILSVLAGQVPIKVVKRFPSCQKSLDSIEQSTDLAGCGAIVSQLSIPREPAIPATTLIATVMRPR
jgi:hypothetical protein